MNETPATSPATPSGPALPEPGAPAAATAVPPATAPRRWIVAGAAAAAIAVVVAVVLAWNTQQRLKTLESELVRRQLDSGTVATEARTLARQAEVAARESSARSALLEARVAETTMQRSQLEDLIQSLARSRDENVLADVEASIRVAQQQSAITGSAEPMVLTLKQADERLARFNQPRLERVRRALTQDLERTRNAGVTDVTMLTIRLDDVIRQIDELPLASAPDRRRSTRPAPPAPDAAASAPADSDATWTQQALRGWREIVGHVWHEIRGLVRVTRIDHPEAMLVAPEQAYFVRANLKLRLLNARLALLSRQFELAQSDLRDAHATIERYFDPGSRKVANAAETVRQVMAQSRLVNVPRPDATLAAIAAATAGR